MIKNNDLYNGLGERHQLLWLLPGFYLPVSAATRLTLSSQAIAAGTLQWLELPRVLLLGTGYDLATCVYLAVLPGLYLLLPQRLYETRIHGVIATSDMFLLLWGLAYLAAVEYFLFEDLNARPSLFTVESMVDPHEAFVDLWRSHPVVRALLPSALLAAAGCWHSRAAVRATLAARSHFADRLPPLCAAGRGAAADPPVARRQLRAHRTEPGRRRTVGQRNLRFLQPSHERPAPSGSRPSDAVRRRVGDPAEPETGHRTLRAPNPSL